MVNNSPVRFDDGLSAGFDELAGAAPIFLNCRPVRPSGVRARPGLRAWSSFPGDAPSLGTSPVTAMVRLDRFIIYATDDGFGTRNLYAWDNGVVISLSSGATTRIAGSDRLTASGGRSFAFFAGGSYPQKVSTALVSSRLANAPVASDLALISQLVVAVEANTSGLFDWSGYGEGAIESWTTSRDYAEAEARPDPLVACKASARELWMFGTQTTQVYQPDADVTFAPGPSLEVGCLAKRSIVRVDTSMAWLDNLRRIVMSDGRSVEVLSDLGIGATLRSLATVDDCWAFRHTIGEWDILEWVFPSAGRAFAFDTVTRKWSEDRRWLGGTWSAFKPTAYLHMEDEGIHLVGMPDGSIAEMTMDAHTDTGDPIQWVSRTGFNRSEGGRRDVVELNLLARRGEADSNATIGVRWRDDLGSFRGPINRALGDAATRNPVVKVAPCGQPYEARQYEFGGAADAAYSIAEARELWREADF